MNEPTPPPVVDPPPLAASPAAPALSAARPPVWPSLLAPFVAFVASVLASGTGIVIVGVLSDPGIRKGDFGENLERWSEANSAGFPTVVALLLCGQVSILGIAVFFAVLARDRPSRRLGFVRWKCSFPTVAMAVLGALGVQFLIDLVAASLIEEPSDSLKELSRMFLEPQGLAAVGVGFLMSVLPGVCEEALFRGFTQRGLLRRWSPAVAIGATSFLFALMHMDLQHSLLVLPLGAWFGFVAWRTGSVWPAVLCHFANNLAAFVVLRIWGNPESLDNPDVPAFYAVGAALVLFTVLATFRLMQTKPVER